MQLLESAAVARVAKASNRELNPRFRGARLVGANQEQGACAFLVPPAAGGLAQLLDQIGYPDVCGAPLKGAKRGKVTKPFDQSANRARSSKRTGFQERGSDDRRAGIRRRD